MAKVDLHNFFKFYDEKNPNHVKGIQWLEDNLPVTYLEDDADWAEIYRGKKTSATVAPVAVAPPAPVPAWEPAKPPVVPTASKDDFPAAGLKLIKRVRRLPPGSLSRPTVWKLTNHDWLGNYP
jgi:hypothetical protein